MRSIPAAGRARALIAAFCTLCLASVSIAQTPSSPPSVWEPGGSYDYGGLTREQANLALSEFEGRMRAIRYNERTTDIYLASFNADSLSSSILLGYRFSLPDEGVPAEGWVFALASFHQGAEQAQRWAISTECPQIADVVDAFRQVPRIGLNVSGPGRAGPIPSQGYESYEVFARSVAQFEDGYRSQHLVTIAAQEGPIAELVRQAKRSLWPCWQDQIPEPPHGSRWRGRD